MNQEKQPIKKPADDYEETPFNMAMMFYYRLSQRIFEKDQAYLSNKADDWYKGLRTIYRSIIFKIDQEDEEELEKWFKEAKNMIQAKEDKNLDKISQTLDKIDIKLTKIMDKKNMIFPKILVKGGLKSIERKLNIEDLSLGDEP